MSLVTYVKRTFPWPISFIELLVFTLRKQHFHTFRLWKVSQKLRAHKVLCVVFRDNWVNHSFLQYHSLLLVYIPPRKSTHVVFDVRFLKIPTLLKCSSSLSLLFWRSGKGIPPWDFLMEDRKPFSARRSYTSTTLQTVKRGGGVSTRVGDCSLVVRLQERLRYCTRFRTD